MKRLISFLLALIIVFGFLPILPEAEAATVSATPPVNKWSGEVASSFHSGSGTKADPYYIMKPSELAYLAQSVNSGNTYSGKYIELASSLDLSGYDWTPIGNENNVFYGKFNGNGYTISNLYIGSTHMLSANSRIYDRIGLFGKAAGTIENFTITGSINVDYSSLQSRGDIAVGSVLGRDAGGNVRNVNSSVSIKVTRSGTNSADEEFNVGGIVGFAQGSVHRSLYSGTIQVTGAKKIHCGGILGSANYGTARGCAFTGSVSGSASGYAFVGGVIGYLGSSGKVLDCASRGSVSGTATASNCYVYAGGLVGYQTGGTVETSYASGNVAPDTRSANGGSSNAAGGLVGYSENSSTSSTVKNCVAMCAQVSAYAASNTTSAGYVVGLINGSGTYTNNFYNPDMAVSHTAAQDSGCNGTEYVTQSGATDTTGTSLTSSYYSNLYSSTLGWTAFTSVGSLTTTSRDVWKYPSSYSASNKPTLYYESCKTLTIRYLTEGNQILDIYHTLYPSGTSVTVTSPTFSGYVTADTTVTSSSSSNTFVDVVYTHEHIPGDPATCLQQQVCTMCGAVLADYAPHLYDDTVFDPTCTENGYTVHTCSVCGDTYRDGYTSPHGHKLDENYRCTVCDAQFDRPFMDYTVYVYDIESNGPAANVDVTIGEKNLRTDSTGAAKFQLDSYAQTKLVITGDGYPEYAVDAYTPVNIGVDYIYLTSNESEIYGAWCNGDNVINGDSQINAQAHMMEALIEVKGRAKANILRYELVQGGSVIATSEDGEFRLYNLRFKIGEDVYVHMYTDGTDGHNHFERKLNIKVVGYTLNLETDLGKLLPFDAGLKLTFPDGTPGLAGAELSFPAPFLKDSKITCSYGNNKVFVVIGKEKDFAENPALDKLTGKQLFEKALDKWLSESKKSAKKEVFGSLAMVIEFDETGVTKVYGQINVGFNLSASRGQTFMVGIIPVYGEVAISAKGELEITEIGFDPGTMEFFSPEHEFTLTGTLTLYGGLGVPVVSVGVYGEGIAQLVLSDQQESIFEKFMLRGELGLYAKMRLLFFKEICYKYPLLSGVMSWPDHVKSARTLMLTMEEYETAPRAYLENRSEWLYGASTYGLTADGVLQESVYTGIEPKLVTCGDTVMMLYMDDDGSEGLNYQRLCYSLYDAESATWSAPLPVDSNDHADLEFDVYSDGEGIYLAYTEMEPISESDQDNYEKLLSSVEVIAARFDPASGTFVSHTNVSGNDSFDSMPRIGTTEYGPTVAWVNNFTADVFSQNANNVVMAAAKTDTGWTDARELTERGATVVSMDVGMLEGQSYVAVIRDVDCDLATVDDRALDLLDWSGNARRIFTGSDENDGVQFVTLDGVDQLVWYNGRNLHHIAGAEDTAAALFAQEISDLTGEYKFVNMENGDAVVLFPRNQQGEDDTTSGSLYGVYYTDGTWGAPVAVTEGQPGRYLDAYDAIWYDGALLIPYISAEVEMTETDMLKTCDFRFARVEPGFDLVAGEAYFPASELLTGDQIQITVPITNAAPGRLTQISYAVQDSLGTTVSQGEIILPEGGWIESGDTAEVTFTLPKDVLTVGESYSVCFDTTDWADADPDNNQATLELWCADFAVDATQVLLADQYQIQYAVTNRGNIAGDVVVKVYRTAADGTRIELDSHTISGLEIGRTIGGTFAVTGDYFEDGASRGTIFVEVAAAENDLYDYNNQISLAVGGLSSSATTEVPDSTILFDSPVIPEPFVSYDKHGGAGITVTVEEKGCTFTGIANVDAQYYSYSSGTLTISNDYLLTLPEGYHCLTLCYAMGDQTTEVLLLIEVADNRYASVEITAADHTVKFDGYPVELVEDIAYTTVSLGHVWAEYSVDDGAAWTTGLPTQIGSYLVKLHVDEDDTNRYLAAECTFRLTIEIGTRAISVPHILGTSGGQVCFGDAIPTAGPSDGTILYGYSTENDVQTVTQWSEEGILPSVAEETTYYVFAKIVGGENYEDAYSLGYAVGAHVHEYTGKKYTSCTEQGYTVYVCRCGDSYISDYVEPTGHTYGDWVETAAPTCTEDGEETRTCHCGHAETRSIPATGHSYTSVVTPPNCTEQGYTTYTCHCGESYIDDYVAATGHTYGDWVETIAPACTDKGEEIRTCHCGHEEKQEIPAAGHAYGDWVETTAPTCTEDGEETRTCHCGHAEKQEIAATGHSHEAVVTAPTCTEQGYTTYTCYCGDSYVSDYVEPTGHHHVDGVCPDCGDQLYLLGDVNNDGKINLKDVNLIVAYYNGNLELTDVQIKAADVNGDGKVNLKDVNLIVSHYNGIIDRFPAESQ